MFRANTDGDQYLSQDELLYYVLKNVEMHLKEAKDKNSQLFILIDSNGDGKKKRKENSLIDFYRSKFDIVTEYLFMFKIRN